jgi:hypothetical protein
VAGGVLTHDSRHLDVVAQPVTPVAHPAGERVLRRQRQPDRPEERQVEDLLNR